ncbi:NAD(P)H-dependent oxidoreductase [Pistricoccus aurantiacus]|uniref:NAD(P)H-dependent oxidoreductase n=1 Tax=Pistricoccus aurantiacus TaxID=1883414 RepID=A0A5B8STA0_9GAMM|nr:NAD(P)H-dependent oxidoreductase [Pistricoccus aurantiacus]QEA38735.1 NAD(P)H-dependent oxidoreductase [Pistricoccus aurantiacus]
MKLTIILTSTRPGRVGKTVADWFHAYAQANAAGFEIEFADLQELNLPMLDEPNHPAMQKYEHEHTKRWSKIVDDSDAFIFVLPEYNYTPPPTFINAVDYLYNEWNYKPAGFVSYGGISGGIRSTEIAKHLLNTLEMVPIKQQVMIPMVTGHLEDGTFVPTDIHEKSAQTLLETMARWAKALKTMR